MKKKIREKRFISLVLAVVIIFGLFAGFSISVSGEYITVEKIHFPNFDEWYVNTYGSEYSAASAEIPIAGTRSFSEPLNDVSEMKYIGPTGGKFITPIEPIDNKTGWIEINDRAGLEKMADNLSGKYYLSADIYLNDVEWLPIGDNSTNSSASRFTGIFDGQGYVIHNLTIGTIKYAGLFGGIENATIKNVGLEGICINTTDFTSSAGGICGYGFGIIISNCYSTGDVSASASGSSAGGICGSGSDITIINCYNTSDILASSAGGICGSGSGITINNCYNTGDVSASSYVSYAGGIYGSGSNITINNCYNTGNVSASSSEADSFAGGICGSGSGITTKNCYSTGDVSASAYISSAGGICGSGSVTINNCYWNSDSEQIVQGVLQTPQKGVGNGTDNATSLTTEQMKQQSSFVGFNFDTVWDLKNGVNEGYPFLRSNSHAALDFTALFSKIEVALAVADNVIVSANGSELWEDATDKFWVTAEKKDELYEAVTNSYKIIVKAVIQSEVGLAVENLNKAVKNFLAAKKLGTGVLLNYNKLIKKIDEAILAKVDVIISEDSSEIEYHWWVTKTVMDEFNGAIIKAINKLTSTNQVEIDTEEVELDEAIQKFLAARKRGIGKFVTNYTIQGVLIADILPQTNRLMFAASFYTENKTEDLIVNVYNCNGKLLENGENVGTGMTVKIMIAGKVAGEFEAVIHGDVTGDGNSDIEDAKAFLEYLVGNKNLTESQSLAVKDYDNDDFDIKKLRAFLNFVMNMKK